MAVTDHGHDARMNGALVQCRNVSALTGQTAVSVAFKMTTFLAVIIEPILTDGDVNTEIFHWVQDTTDTHIVKVWSIDNTSTTNVRVTAIGY
ncbi:MAG TPA: hypothetical protein VMZ92_09205 [Planctomycetota bacterium]|nr:hypothetical protein [Planctomycetota bacterium]